jgi:hypothetical protein
MTIINDKVTQQLNKIIMNLKDIEIEKFYVLSKDKSPLRHSCKQLDKGT